MDLIRKIALAINLAIWTVVGFMCWIPLIFRATASLAAAILVSTFNKSDPRPLRANFENAVSFYSRGYDTIHKVLGGDGSATWDVDAATQPTQIKWDRVVLEIVWTSIFWGTILFALFRLYQWLPN